MSKMAFDHDDMEPALEHFMEVGPGSREGWDRMRRGERIALCWLKKTGDGPRIEHRFSHYWLERRT